MKLDLILKVLMGLLLAGLGFVLTGIMSQPNIQVGDRAPEFSVTASSGKTITRDNFGGKLLVLNFWATWCPPCVAEMPSLNEFQRQLGGDGVVVLAVSIDKNEAAMRQFIQRFGLRFETAHDPSAAIAASYGTFRYPESYIIDAKGQVIEKLISEQDWADPKLIARVKRYL